MFQYLFKFFKKEDSISIEKYLEEIEPIVDINLKVEKMDHNYGIDIVLNRVKEFEYESKGVKYFIYKNFKIFDVKKINNQYIINLKHLYKNYNYCHIIKNLEVKLNNKNFNEKVNYEIVIKNKITKENINNFKNIKNIPICFYPEEEIFLTFVKDIINFNTDINVSIEFEVIVLRKNERELLLNKNIQEFNC